MSEGKLRGNLYELRDEGVPIGDIVSAADEALKAMSSEMRDATMYHIDSPEWRSWSNPEFLLSDKGIRLDEVSDTIRKRVLSVLRATLSPQGYDKALKAMEINHFLGELVQSPCVLNRFSYNFVIFGEPSQYQPWGYSFYGHHLCLNIFLIRSQIVISPWFTGAEPNLIDAGINSGTQILQREEQLGLCLMQSLQAPQQKKAQIFKLMKDPSMPEGRWNHDDQRHLCGAYRDNRVVPYEGILVSEFNTPQQELVIAILEEYLIYLPQGSRERYMEKIEACFHETYWCWIGGFGDEDPFYYRIQSPVILIEFDHHSGVFLTNKEPAKFHIHTLLRMPNQGDYGMSLRPLIAGLEQNFVWQGDSRATV